MNILIKSPSGKNLKGFLKYKNEVKIGSHYYTYVRISNQLWITENLREPIGSEGVDYWWYDNDQETYEPLKFGCLYAWYTCMKSSEVMSDAMAALCPEGWHIPTNADWNELTNTLGGSSIAGKKLKTNSDMWTLHSTYPGSDEVGMHIVPAGFKLGSFDSKGINANIWSSTEFSSENGYNFYITDVVRPDVWHPDSTYFDTSHFKTGISCSVRLVKNLDTNKKLLKSVSKKTFMDPIKEVPLE